MKRVFQMIAAAMVAALTIAGPAAAQSAYPTPLNRVVVPATVPLQCNASNAACLPISAANPQAVNQPGVTATGSLAALNAAAPLAVQGNAGWAVDVRGTFVGTITFQSSVDGTNWIAAAMLPVGSTTNAATVTTTAAVGAWMGNAAGMSHVRAIMTAYTSGTATVTLRAFNNAGVVLSLPAGATAQTVNATAQPSANLIGDVGFQYRATSTGAATAVSILSPVTPAGALMKSGAGRLIGCFLTNTAAALRSVKFYNATSVTMGTTSAAFEIDLPQNAYGTFNLPGGIGFTTGIMTATTAAKGLTDNTATGLAASDVSGTCWFL